MPGRRASNPAVAALDDSATVERLDSQGLLARIDALPEQCEEAWRAAADLRLPEGYRSAREALVLGMGGSAIAGDVLRTVAALGGRMPASVVRGYALPSSAGERTLAIVCSHSGNTEETLAAFQQALERGAKTVVVTTGGRLLELARQHGVPAFVYAYNGEPRSAIGHQLMALLGAGERAGLLEAQASAVGDAVVLMREQRAELGIEVPAARNLAKQIAGRLHGRLPIVVGSGVLSVAAYRWKTQFNENSKSWALQESLPELGHNTIVGFGGPKELLPKLHVLFLSHAGLEPELLRSEQAASPELDAVGVSHERVEAQGSGALAQILTGIYLGDYVSYYLALLNGVEPSPVAPIARYKQRLAGG